MYLAVFIIYKPQKIFNIPLYKFRMPADCIGYIFLFFTRWHETTIFRAWKAKKSRHSALFTISFIFYRFSHMQTRKLCILSRKPPASFRDNTGSFRDSIRILPDSIDFCLIVQRFPCLYPSFRDNKRLLPTSIYYQAKQPQNNRSYPH